MPEPLISSKYQAKDLVALCVWLSQSVAKTLNQKLFSSRLFSFSYTSIFKRIRILDSTAFQLLYVFSLAHHGAGGCSYRAGVKSRGVSSGDETFLTTKYRNIPI